MRRTYLTELYHYDRRLFFLIAAFAALTILCNLLGKETTPFFVWGMYSEKIRPVKNYDILRITINDTVLVDAYAGYSDNTRTYLNAPLAYFREIKNNNIDPVIPFLKNKLKDKYKWISPFEKQLFNAYRQHDFAGWYHCYLERVTGVNVHSVRMDILRAQFDGGQHLFLDSSYLFEAWRQQ